MWVKPGNGRGEDLWRYLLLPSPGTFFPKKATFSIVWKMGMAKNTVSSIYWLFLPVGTGFEYLFMFFS
jgi:hypothetical protein